MTNGATPGLAKIVGHGMSWAMLGTVWAKGANFAAQIVLGYLLTQSEWGVYAIAISVAAFVTTFRDGGVRELLVQRGPDAYEDLRGPVFWLGLAVNSAITVVLVGLAFAAAAFYREPGVRDLVLILALALFLDTPAQLLRAKLRIELRFGALARLTIATATMRYGGAIFFAWLDFGALSFVLPLPLISIFEWIVLAVLTSERLLALGPAFERWASLLGEVKWLLIGSGATVLSTMGDYAVLGRLIPAAALGVYYFAFQLSVNASMLAAANFNAVLMPSLVRVVGDVDRERRATIRALRALALVAAPLSLGFAAVIEPLEALVWGGRWSAAVVPVQVLSIVLPIRLSFMLATSSLKARGLFRLWAALSIYQGVGLVLVSVIVGALTSSPSLIAAVIALYWLIASPVALRSALRGVLGDAQIARTLLPSTVLAVAAAAFAGSIDFFLARDLEPIVRLVIITALFLFSFLVLVRALIRDHLVDTLRVLPSALGRLASRVLRVDLT